MKEVFDMAEIKDKVVTAESLKALLDYIKETYVTMINSEVLADLTVEGDIYSDGVKVVKSTDIIPIANGGTNSSNGATGLKNLFSSGATILSSYQYGDTLPTAGTKGRIFFKRLVE